MEPIRIDFDQVTRFAGLHRDIGSALNSHRSVFRADSNHVDQVIAAFRLARPEAPIATAMGEADARAAQVAETLASTSTRILNHVRANQSVDTSFNWGAVSQAAFALLTAPFSLVAVQAVSRLFGSPTAADRKSVPVTRTESSRDLLASKGRASSEELPNSRRTWEKVQPYYEAAAMSDNRYQCVSWVWVRIRELQYPGGLIAGGTNGANMAKDLSVRDGRLPDIEPKLGAVVSAPTSDESPDGHVFVIEQVDRDSSGRVIKARYSEMNSKGHAAPGDFQSSEWIFRTEEGDTFHREGKTESLTIFNPEYPPDSPVQHASVSQL